MKKRINRILNVPVRGNKWLLLIGLYLMMGVSVFLSGCEESNDNNNSDNTTKENVAKPVPTEEATTEGMKAKNNWYQSTKLVTKDMKLRELNKEELEKLVQFRQELFAGLSEREIAEITEKLWVPHGGLEAAIVYYDFGTLSDSNSEQWQWFDDTTPDNHVDDGHWAPEVIRDLEDVKEKLSDTRVINLITEAQNEIQAIVDERSNVHVMKAHTILHDLDYWLFRYPPEGFEDAPADWTGINIYYGELDGLLADTVLTEQNPYQPMIEFSQNFINDLNGAIAESGKVNLEGYIKNENLLAFAYKMVELTHKQDVAGENIIVYGGNNIFRDDENEIRELGEGIYYLSLPFQYEGSGMFCQLIVKVMDESMEIVDFYFGNKDAIDTMATGHPAVRKVDNPERWNDEAWVAGVFSNIEDYEEEHK